MRIPSYAGMKLAVGRQQAEGDTIMKRRTFLAKRSLELAC